MSVTTSGTVSAYPFNLRKVLDHAFRRAGHAPESLTAELLDVGRDLVFSQTSQWINAGFPLWTRQFLLLGCQIGSPDVSTPIGTNDVFHTYWRILQPYRAGATTTTGADASVLFGGQPNADVTIVGPNPGVIVSFGSATEVDTIGVLLGGSTTITAALQVKTSTDGITFTTTQTLPSTTYTPQQWKYFDLDPAVIKPWISLVVPQTGAVALNQLNFGLANGQDTEIGPLNIDDYFNLPNKQFQSDRANSAYVDRLLNGAQNGPVIKIWPTLNQGGFYNGTISALVRRYIQDPGTLTQNVEVPQRWLEALIWRLASVLIYEIPDPSATSQPSYFTLMAKQQRVQQIEQNAAKAEMLAWSEERNRSPIRLTPNISPYTR